MTCPGLILSRLYPEDVVDPPTDMGITGASLYIPRSGAVEGEWRVVWASLLSS